MSGTYSRLRQKQTTAETQSRLQKEGLPQEGLPQESLPQVAVGPVRPERDVHSEYDAYAEQAVAFERKEAHERPVGAEADEPAQQGHPPKKKKARRVLKRFSHDLYIDQMETLSTKTRAFFLMQGKNKSVAHMLREAVDTYIEKNQ